ncbi:energy transducer TonB [Mucilaginibacter sp.]|uniref:energy transducer TonB n=1 Tax=Mucilaginibacter sp. TaxID=1882438 RepID=UPI0026106922|nr:energy transducer TonB [Mucilaginibacter sp.]MDB5031202.1 TonB family protein [Mucilaginibacter sp.]
MKNIYLTVLFISVFIFVVQAQDTTKNSGLVYTFVEKQPEFPGGQSVFINFLSKNLQYPTDSWNKHIGGKVIVSFIVERDGSISNVKILRHVADDLDAEAIRVINISPKWYPGIEKNSPVRVSNAVPITFTPPLKRDTTTILDTLKYQQVEKTPQYPGGLEALYKFINKNLQGRDNKGKVITSFVVEKDGSISDIKVVKSLSKTADTEAIRVIGLMPKWEPGIQGGRPVRVMYSVPINFSMN